MPGESILETIIAHKRAELAAGRRALPKRRRAMHDFHAALARNGMRLILECKRASPSSGAMHDGSLAPVVEGYRGIADAVSVLTDVRFFGGSMEDLAFVAAQVNVPVLRKDFILDPVQVREAHAFGSDAVLLMLSALDDNEWRACAREAERLRLDVLTEVHDEIELERALALDARIIGINNRSLADLSVDLAVTEELAPRIPAGRIVVCESGIRDHRDVRTLAPHVNAFLVGSALMCAPRVDFAARELASGEVKICGLTCAGDALAAWRAGARWGGVVFAPGSPRRIDAETARVIAAASPLPLVGVFVDADPQAVGQLARDTPLAAVQLHGNEDAERVAATRAALPGGCALWKSIHAGAELSAPADRVLFDGSKPGSGTRWDWSQLPPRASMSRHGLAGGIHAGNVREALATGAGLIDVSTGVESAPGVKSPERLAALFDAIRVAIRLPAHESREKHHANT